MGAFQPQTRHRKSISAKKIKAGFSRYELQPPAGAGTIRYRRLKNHTRRHFHFRPPLGKSTTETKSILEKVGSEIDGRVVNESGPSTFRRKRRSDYSYGDENARCSLASIPLITVEPRRPVSHAGAIDRRRQPGGNQLRQTAGVFVHKQQRKQRDGRP